MKRNFIMEKCQKYNPNYFKVARGFSLVKKVKLSTKVDAKMITGLISKIKFVIIREMSSAKNSTCQESVRERQISQ